MIPVKAVQDDSCHWYLIPNSLYDQFCKDLTGIDDIEFDNKYSKYRTGGALNSVQLYIN